MKPNLPPGYFAQADRLAILVRDVACEHGAPSFLLPPHHVWVPAPLDLVGKPLALNDSARVVVTRSQGTGFTLMMLDAIVQVGRYPHTRLTLPDFLNVIRDCGVAIGIATTTEGEALLRGAMRKGPTS